MALRISKEIKKGGVAVARESDPKQFQHSLDIKKPDDDIGQKDIK
jgi:hypothetical protein